MSCSNLTLHVLCSITIHTMMCVIISRKPYQTKQSMADLEISPMNITVRQSRQSGVARATCPD